MLLDHLLVCLTLFWCGKIFVPGIEEMPGTKQASAIPMGQDSSKKMRVDTVPVLPPLLPLALDFVDSTEHASF